MKRFKIAKAPFFGVGLAGVALIASLGGGCDGLERVTEDWRASAFALDQPRAKVVVVLIDEVMMATEAPWNRPVALWGSGFETLLRKLDEKGAKTVAIDVVLTGSPGEAVSETILDAEARRADRLGLNVEADAGPLPNLLTALANDLPNLPLADLLGSFAERGTPVVMGEHPVFPIDEGVKGLVLLGDVSVPPSPDERIRRLFYRTSNDLNGLAYETALAAGARMPARRIGETFRFDEVRSIPVIPLTDALADSSQTDSLLRDAVVLVGIDRLDQRATSLHSSIPGVFVQANGVASLLDNRLVREWGWALWVGLAAAVAGVAFLRTASLGAPFAWFSSAIVVWAVAGTILYAQSRVLIPIVAPATVFGAALVGMAVGRSVETDQIYALIGPVLSPKVLDYILATPKKELWKGRLFQVTAMFVDLRDSTAICAALPGGDFSKRLNEFFDATTSCVRDHGGVVSRLTGDGFFAFFGFPEPSESSTRDAFAAAVAIVGALEAFNDKYYPGIEPKDTREPGSPVDAPWKLGVGLYEGPLLLAAVGTKDRWEFTAVGETVIRASRMESLTKELEAEIVVSERVRNALDAKDRASLIERPNTPVKGVGPMTVYLWRRSTSRTTE